MSPPEPPFPTGPQLTAGFREAFRWLGMWTVLPWALGVTTFLAGGEGALAYAVWGGGDASTTEEVFALMAGPCLVAIALFLAFVVAISGTVSEPLRAVLGGRAAGLAAVAGLSVAVFAGCAGPVSGRLALAWVAVLGGAGLAGAGSFAWARMSYDSPVGGAVAASWAALLALLPLLPLVAAR